MTGKLYLCATPIGNLEDITYRVLKTLKEADLIAAEDTRHSIKLLNHFDIKTPMTSYHEYNKVEKAKYLVEKMAEGTNIALITDAGTPGISDPGEELVRQCYEAGIPVTSLPGPAACITALTMSGLPTRRFCFEAFLPAEKSDKKERQRILEELKNETRTIILYEAPHRLVRTLEELTDEYMHKFGYTDVNVTTVFHQWMGGFPADEAKAFGVISWGAACAALAKATKVIVKTPHEAAGVPTKEANAQGLRCTKQLTNMLVDQVTVGSRLEHEKEVIKAETRCIMDKVIALGHGDIILGAIAAINAGVIDIPFGPAKCNAGIMLPARDNGGAVRILEVGNLPFTDDLKKFHKEKLAERGKAENREVSFQMVIDDVYAISKGRLVGRPRY